MITSERVGGERKKIWEANGSITECIATHLHAEESKNQAKWLGKANKKWGYYSKGNNVETVCKIDKNKVMFKG